MRNTGRFPGRERSGGKRRRRTGSPQLLRKRAPEWVLAETRYEAETGATEKRTAAGAEGEGEHAEPGERPTGADWRTICRR